LISVYEHRCILFDFYVVNAACSRRVKGSFGRIEMGSCVETKEKQKAFEI
jgi:hypothetical protein